VKGKIDMLNICTIMGRLTRDPELRHTGSNIPVASFTLAVDRDRKNQNGEKETDFIDVAAWRATADFVSKYFAKGQMAVVSGRLQMRKWEDKDGNKRVSAEIVADSVYFGESKKDEQVDRPYVGGGRRANDAEMASMQPTNYAVLDDQSELPF
jgi:single-strand DNA-binding protein